TLTFDLVSAPLRPHGAALDWLFAGVPSDKVLLVDSDLEILGPAILAFMREFIDDECTFGCGFVNGPGWLDDHGGTILDHAYYAERPWIPLTLLKVGFVREALRAGRSFLARTVYNDFAPSQVLSRLIAEARWRLPFARRLGGPKLFRPRFNGVRP